MFLLQLLLSKIQQLEKEISTKANGNDNLEISNQTLLVELGKLEQVQRQNGDLKDEVKVVNQKNKELQYKIGRDTCFDGHEMLKNTVNLNLVQ